MNGRQSAQNGRSDESITVFMDRRRQETAQSGAKARAAAHEAYGRAIRSGQDLALNQPSDAMAHGARVLVAQGAKKRPATPTPSNQPFRVGHPGFAEALIPVWGSGKEAIADFQDGDYLGAALNGALAGSDFFLGTDIAKAVGKGGLFAIKGAIGKKAGKQTWAAVRKEMQQRGMIKPGQHGHHWLIPQNGWGKAVPDVIKNHPINIKLMPDYATHMQIHGLFGFPKYSLPKRLYYGTPTWAKVAAGETVGRPVAEFEKRKPQP